eukprot:2184224-Karenia_brevis.AAC.1
MQFAGVLVNHDICVPREVNGMDYQEKNRTGNDVYTKCSVMNLLCGDDTAVIQVSLWNETLASFKRQLDSLPPGAN